jgi:DNA polymerase
VDPAAQLDSIAAEIRMHRDCAFEPCRTCTNFVPGEGNPRAEVVIVGEAPGATEDAEGRPFVGRAGRLLDEVLAAAGVRREDVFITNVVKARPPRNRDPSAAEVAHHWPWLERELAIVAPRLLVPLGRHALSRFAPRARISDVHGRALPGAPALFPLYHPAAALRSTRLRETLFEDARRLGATLS